jgi:hypothetical protein
MPFNLEKAKKMYKKHHYQLNATPQKVSLVKV